MEDNVSKKFESHFSKLKDLRINRKKLHPLMEILFVVLCGSICGAESWRDFVLFGQEKIDFLKLHFPFKNGIASKDTIARLFYSLEPETFKTCFIEWVKYLQTSILKDVVAIDGKTLCNSIDKLNNVPAIHMVSAFSTATRLVLAQQKVDDKSNEITAIPILLDLLNLKGSTVTIDAIGCQKTIAAKIIEKEADYVLALKGNQGSLNDDVRLFIESEIAKKSGSAIEDVYEDIDKGHGRLETRTCFVTSSIDWFAQKPEWAGLKTIAMIEETRQIKGKISVERRFFISSLSADAKQIASTVRAHWLIENALHWTLDVVFNEDYSRVRDKNAGQNMAIVRHIAYNMLENGKKHYKNIGIKKLRKKAGWGNSALDVILRQNF